jgi:uncharacterized membrane-anchored protein
MPNNEQGVPIQTDQLTTVPGGPIRTVTVTVMVNGVATPMQMQVIAIADENGVLIGQPCDPRQLLGDIANILADIRTMVSKLADMPFVNNQENRFDHPGVIL